MAGGSPSAHGVSPHPITRSFPPCSSKSQHNYIGVEHLATHPSLLSFTHSHACFVPGVKPRICPVESDVVSILKTYTCRGREWKVNSQCFNREHAIAGDGGKGVGSGGVREQRKG